LLEQKLESRNYKSRERWLPMFSKTTTRRVGTGNFNEESKKIGINKLGGFLRKASAGHGETDETQRERFS
jgi:hypothetical protein